MGLTQDQIDEKAGRRWAVVTPPSVEPITVEELKTFARLDTSDEDSLLADCIASARESAEQYTGRAFIERTLRLSLDYWPGDAVELPFPPLVSVSSIKLVDESGTEETYDSANYYVVTEGIPGKVAVKQSASFPSTASRDYSAYRITYVAGYGSTASYVPSQIRQSLLLWAAAIYDSRAPLTEAPPHAQAMLKLYKVPKL